jgi:soluble lytic murein transglycosylase-like protein
VPTKTGIQSLDRWDGQFAAASRSTGLPANYLKAVAWAESRGNAGAFSHNPDGRHNDLGVMQISDYTYGDVMSNQSRAPRGLRAGDPADNIMMGAWELKDKFGRYGQNKSYAKTSAAYRGVGDGKDLSYGNAVVRFWEQMNQGDKPSDNGPW